MNAKEEKEACTKLFKNLKKRRMTKTDKTLDKFCREVLRCTLYPGGSAYGDKKAYELYSGNDIIPENFVKVITQKEIIHDDGFKKWYEEDKKQQ